MTNAHNVINETTNFYAKSTAKTKAVTCAKNDSETAGKFGLLIDYEFCTGCETCVVACKKEHDFPVGKWGIRVLEDGPWQKIDGEEGGRGFNWNKIPVPTDLCDLCGKRTARGKIPSCVHHCQAFAIKYGTIKELAKIMVEKPKQVLWFPRVT